MSTQGDRLKAIADAIRAKEGSSDPIVASDFPARIAAIETGTQLPTLTNPGTAADLASGKQLIDQNGEIVTGTVLVRTGYTPQTDWNPVSTLPGYALCATELDQDTLLRVGTMGVNVPLSKFGDATAADVAAGKTFTSEAGVKVTGTAAPASYLKGFSATITGNGGNGAWLSYAGQVLPLALFISMYQGISTGNNLFTLLAFGQMGAYTTGSFRSVIEEVSYGSQKSGVLSITQSGGQLHIQLPSNCYFGSGDEYLVGGFYT